MKLYFVPFLLLFVGALDSPTNAIHEKNTLTDTEDSVTDVIRVKDSLRHEIHLNDQLLQYRGITVTDTIK